MRLSFFFLMACSAKVQVAEDTSTNVTQDLDGDGFETSEDCDDSDDSVYPSATELCDGIDNNCDGAIDEGVTDTFYADEDGDGFGSSETTTEACSEPEGFVAMGTDCDDANENAYPSAEEVCDGVDNDCNDEIDEGLGSTYYTDNDGDGFGDDNAPVEACLQTTGLALTGGDCDDQNINIAPNAIEVCDEVDNNCNGSIDEGVTTTFYADSDTDGFGNADTPIEACTLPAEASENDLDCNDVDSFIHPEAEEICDEVDNNCDGAIDESGATNEGTWYNDGDGDGFGDPDTVQFSCTQPPNHVSNAEDCNDGNNEVAPNQPEVCNNGKDDNCDGQENETGAIGGTEYYLDSDADGFGSSANVLDACSLPSGYSIDSTDCNDNDEDVYVGASEICDGKDNNCDGNIDENTGNTYYLDADEDGFGDATQSEIACTAPLGYVTTNTDCNDGDATISPNASELCDGIDNDCDALTDESDAIDQQVWFVDSDGDGHGSPTQTAITCDAPTGYVASYDDCVDGDAAISPSATETCDGIDNDCDGSIDQGNNINNLVYYLDSDVDGYGAAASSVVSCSEPSGYVTNLEDCNDGDTDINPDAADFCDGVDNDCSGGIDDDIGYYGLDEVCAADSCLDVKTEYSAADDGVYWVDPDGTGAHEVYCDQTTDGGGWSLISVVRNDDPSQVIVADTYCTTLSTTTNCKGRMSDSDALLALEVMVFDLPSNDHLIYDGFETDGAFGYFTMDKQLNVDSTCSGFGHTCGTLPDPNLSIAGTSGYTYNYNAPLYQWWRVGGWWVGAAPSSGGNAGRVHASSYGSSHDLRNRSSANANTGSQATGHQALYFR
jgi:hypothetical protein